MITDFLLLPRDVILTLGITIPTLGYAVGWTDPRAFLARWGRVKYALTYSACFSLFWLATTSFMARVSHHLLTLPN